MSNKQPMLPTRLKNQLAAALRNLPSNARGALWVTMGTIAFALNDVVIKYLGRTIHPIELAWTRYVVGAFLLAPVFYSMGWAQLRTQRFGIHMVRLAIACVAQVGVFYAVIHLTLADATAITFSRPLFTTIIAVFLLSELVRWQRWTATAVGFVGVIVMMRPESGALNQVALIAVGSAFIFALANVMIKIMSTTEPPNRILFYYHVGGMVFFAGPAWAVWVTPEPHQWPLMFLIGVFTTLGMIGFIRGFSAGEASIVGPMEYTRLIYAALLGYYLFAEIPDMWTGFGAVIIIGCTLYIARHEAMGGKAP